LTQNQAEVRYWIGIDLGGEDHKICVLAADGKNLRQSAFAHSGSGLEELFQWLQQQTGPDPGAVAVGLENPRGAVVEMLLERNYRVWSINPKQLDRFRDRFSVAGAKDDYRDARVFAHSLRTDQACFRSLAADHAQVLRLRELSRGSDQTGRELRRMANQLNDLLRRYFPSLVTLCPGSDEVWLWALPQRASLPTAAARMKRDRLEKLLQNHRIRRFSADQLHTLLQATPLPIAPGSAAAIAEQVKLLLPRLVQLQQQKLQLDKKIDLLLEELASDASYSQHHDVTILRSIPGLGRVFIATVLSEASRPLATRDYRALRGLAGIAPVTKQSGKTKLVSMRLACNRRLHVALHHATTSHAQHDDRARRQYAQLRQKGHSHGRAIRGVADRLLALLIAMLKTQTVYSPERRKIAAA
jgi:transposase